MANAAADDFSRIPMSSSLSATLGRAADYARAQSHTSVTLEHLLLALTEDDDAEFVLASSNLDMGRLKADISAHLGSLTEHEPPGPRNEMLISPDLRRILEAAAAAAQGGRRREINGAIVLAAIIGDGKSPSAHMLVGQGLTFEQTIRALMRTPTPLAHPPAAREPDYGPAAPTPPQSTDDVLAGARARVMNRSMPGLGGAKGGQRSKEAKPAKESDLHPAHELPLPEDGAAADNAHGRPQAVPDGRSDPQHGPLGQEPQFDVPRTGPAPSDQGAPVSPAPPISSHPDLPPGMQGSPDAPARPMPPPSQREVTGAPPGGQERDRYVGPPSPVAGPQGQPPQHGMPTAPPQPGRPAGPPPGGPNRPMPQGLNAEHPGGPGGGAPANFTGGPGPGRPGPPPPPGGRPGGQPARRMHDMSLPMPTGRPGPPGGPGRPAAPPPGGAPYPAPEQMPRAPMRPEPAGERRRHAPAAEISKLAETIPRKMRVGIPTTVEVRIAKPTAKAIVDGLQGPGAAWQHEVTITKAMSVRLRSPGGGFWIETASPETQWLENRGLPFADDVASWRWSVTPRIGGKKKLQLVVSVRTIGGDGLAAETALPDQAVEVRVRANYAGAMKRYAGWIVAAIVGGLLARYGEGAFTIGYLMIAKMLAG